MENDQTPLLSVSDFVAVTNQVFEYSYPSVMIEGEVDSFKVNQNKFVFFNLKDAGASIGCFMMVFALRFKIEDGMKVIIKARPKLTQWGKFSLVVDSIRPSGEGSIKKSFDLMHQKLEREGLFSPERKRLLPKWPRRVALIASNESAGYADFMKIINDRIGGIEFYVYHTAVQGNDAPQQLEEAINRANRAENVADVLVLIRGGGSADDLLAFSDERVVRAVAGSRIPTLAGIGHETDKCLVDFAADVRASTPSNAAYILSQSKDDIRAHAQGVFHGLLPKATQLLKDTEIHTSGLISVLQTRLVEATELQVSRLDHNKKLIESYNPKNVLKRGYAIVRGDRAVGGKIHIEELNSIIEAKVESYEQQ